VKALNRYLFQLFVLTVSAGLILYFLNGIAPFRFQGESWPWVLVFFFLSTLGFHVALTRVSKGDHKAFVRAFMAVSGAKLFLYLIIITIYMLLNRQSAPAFVLQFLICYFMYSAFEVYKLFRMSKD
jgi:hypothetical protein